MVFDAIKMKIVKHVIHIGFSNTIKRQLIMSKDKLSLRAGLGVSRCGAGVIVLAIKHSSTIGFCQAYVLASFYRK